MTVSIKFNLLLALVNPNQKLKMHGSKCKQIFKI